MGQIRYAATTGDFLTAHSKWGGSIRGRLGYAADHALLYVTGGAAFVSNETSIPLPGISLGGDDARVGWTVGAGLDYAFTNNWFTGLEFHLAVSIRVLCIQTNTHPQILVSSAYKRELEQ